MLNIPLMNNNITKEDIIYLIKFLENSEHFTNGIKVKELEQQWSKWLGVKYSLFVNSGSSANFMTMAGIAELYGKGEIIVPTITWSSDISSVIVAGHTPVFVDVNLKNLAMIEEEVLNKVTQNTKAVFLSHILGFNGLTQHLVDELKKRNILLIEDVCESHGAKFGNNKAGAIGFASNFSFYYAHHMSTIEGGMICTNDESFYQFMRMYRSHGMLRESTNVQYKKSIMDKNADLDSEFIFMVPGYNMRSTELNAVIGLNQIKRLDSNIEKRKENFEHFLSMLDKDLYYTDYDLEGSSNYAFVILMKEENQTRFKKLIRILQEENVEFRRGTAGGGNQLRQPYLRKRYPEYSAVSFNNAEKIHFFGLYTGNYPGLEREKIRELANLVNSV